MQAGISTVYQEPYLVPYISIAENIFLGREKRSRFGLVNQREMEEKSKSILQEFSLNIDPRTELCRLSPADIQMVQLARAIAFAAKVLILDEPTASITEHETQILFDLIKKLNNKGLTILYVSHRLKEIFDLCDRATVLRDGTYVGTHSLSEIDDNKLISLMIGRAVESIHSISRSFSNEPPMLELKNISSSAPGVKIKNISINVRRGEIVGLSGLVGSGRSEVAKIIFGLHHFDQGELYFEGIQLKQATPERAIAQGIAYVPEDRKGQGLISTLSVQSNTSLTGLDILSSYGLIAENREEKVAKEAVKKLRIKTSSINANVSSLSGGNQQKVVIGKWLWRKPKFLILDEPTAGIDVAAKAEIHSLIIDLANQGIAVLLISSELPEMLALASRIYVMRDGMIVGEMDRSVATQEAIIRLAAVGSN